MKKPKPTPPLAKLLARKCTKQLYIVGMFKDDQVTFLNPVTQHSKPATAYGSAKAKAEQYGKQFMVFKLLSSYEPVTPLIQRTDYRSK